MGFYWAAWWRDFFGTSPDRDRVAIEILGQRYVEEMQAADRFNQHAQKMHYTQFCENLLQIATDKSKYARWIAEKIISLGGKLPKCRSIAQRTKTVGATCRWI